MHDGAARERRVLRVLRDDGAERGGVLERPAHELGVGDAVPVVAEDRHARGAAGEHAHVGQPLPREPDAHGADGAHGGEARLEPQAVHLLDDRLRVGDRRRVGHREHARVAAGRRGADAGGDGLGLLAAGLAEVRVQVDEPRQRDEAGCVDDVRRVAVDGLGVDERAAVDREVADGAAQDRGAGQDRRSARLRGGHREPPWSDASSE